jgi:reactive chlorine resistance protein C
MSAHNRLFDATAAERLQRIGGALLRWSVVVLLVLFGAMKWTTAEAEAIRPLITHSPLLWWLDRAFGAQGASEVIGVMELITASLIALRRWMPWIAVAGGALGIGTFLTTLSFLVTTPDVEAMAPFILKDLTLLGAVVWLTGEAWSAAVRVSSPSPQIPEWQP